MNALLVNDVHLGVNRTAGTTPESRKALKEHLQLSFRDLLFANLHRDLIINGDLFDTFSVDPYELLFTYYTLSDWLAQANKLRGHISNVRVFMGRGNHDIAKDSDKLSSFDFLCSLLQKNFPGDVFVITGGLTQLYPHVWMIPHVPNQDLFELELNKALSIDPSYILLHANVDNHYADQADHSLNVSGEMIEKLLAHGHTLVFGHEHQHKALYDGNVIVTGNQWPSSISDCLPHGEAQADGLKHAHFLFEAAHPGGGVTVGIDKIVTWDAIGSYIELDWQRLRDAKEERILGFGEQFVRITGSAKAEEAAEVISIISKYRSKSSAFVVGNAVKIEGIAGMEEMASMSEESLKALDVLSILKEHLDPEEAAAVDKLLANRSAK